MRAVPIIILVAAFLILGSLTLEMMDAKAAQTMEAPASQDPLGGTSRAYVSAPQILITVLVATPTPGPDYLATRAAIEIDAAEDHAAGETAYRLAGEAELTRQWALATVEAAEAEIAATQVAELHQVALTGTRQALELAAADDWATATRQAVQALTAEAVQDQERAHAAAIREKERDAELHRATVQQWTRPLSAAVLPLMLFGFVFSAVLLMIRAALARNLADDILDIVERVTGNFAPIWDGTAVPVGSTPSVDVAGLRSLAMGDQDALELLHFARQAGTLAYNKIRAAGYPGGAHRWTRIMERLATDPKAPGGLGWVFIVKATGQPERYVLRSGIQITDIVQSLGGYGPAAALPHPPTPTGVGP